MIQTVTMPKRILVFADATRETACAVTQLKEAGCVVELTDSGAEVLRRLVTWEPDLILVGNVTQSDCSPIELAFRIRSAVSTFPSPTVFVCSGDSDPIDASAPPSTHTSSAAIRQTLSYLAHQWKHWQASHSAISESIACRDLRLDRDRHRVWLSEQPIHLTPTEFNLLWALVSRPGYVLTRHDLSRACKGSDYSFQTRTIDAHVKSIRRKLNDRAGWIETVHGIGYRFQEGER